jgi:dTMP kinase
MPHSQRKAGMLISFEGPEGSGKTTQIGMLARRLEELKREVVVTREPGGTPIGEEIRHLLKHHVSGEAMQPETELLLFAASRAQLVREVITPALRRGAVILSDRYLDSTTVYQGVARSLKPDPVSQINQFAVGEVMPTLTFVIDVPPEVSLARIKRRVSDLPDRMERENIDFYHKIRQGYLVLAQSLPDRFRVIDGTRGVDEVGARIWEEIKPLLG